MGLLAVATDTRWFSSDPLLKTTNMFHGEEDGSFVIATEQDVTDIIEVNQYRRLNTEYKPKAEWRQVASIPMNLYMKMKADGIVDDEPRFRKWMDDRDNRFFRTNDERLSA